MHFNSSAIIPLICAIVVLWFIIDHLRRKKSTEAVDQSQPPIYTEEEVIESVPLEQAFQDAWDNLKNVDGVEVLPVLVTGQLPAPQSNARAYRALVGEIPAIVDPTFTGPVIFYIKADLLWMTTSFSEGPVVSLRVGATRGLVYKRLIEISQQAA